MRRKKIEQEQTKLEKRVASLSNEELTKWVDQAMFTIGRNISSWSKTSEYLYVEEAQLGSEALLAVITELKKRSASSRNF